MAKSLKENGVQELEVFQRRLRRQFTLKRIRGADFYFLEQKLEEMLKRINGMDEIDDDMVGERSGS